MNHPAMVASGKAGLSLIFVFLLGCVGGLRSLTAPAVVCWAAHFGRLNLTSTKLAFMSRPAALIIFTVLAAIELIIDKLPKTPARTTSTGLTARIVLSGLSGAAVGTSAGMIPYLGAATASIGAVVGAFAGYNIRRNLVLRRHLQDFSVALAEDMLAILGGLLIIRRF